MSEERLLDTTIATRIVLGLEVPPDRLQSRLPAPWEVAPVAEGPAAGTNVRVVFNDVLLNQQADGSTAPDAASWYVGFIIPARRPDTGEQASLNLRIYTAHPEAVPGKYLTSKLAMIRRHRHESGVNQAPMIEERFEVFDAGAIGLDFHLEYPRGQLVRAASRARVRSVADPGILRIYQQDELIDQVVSRGAGRDRRQDYRLSVTLPELAALFDGSEQLVSLAVSPWYLRSVSGEAPPVP
jgi:hypothetical protein